MLINKKVISVSDVNKYIKNLISRDIILSDIWIKGEISNYKHHSSGHMYFTLKDEGSLIKCIMFKTQNSRLKFIPNNGMRVIIRTSVSVYERDGQYQCYVQEMNEDGIGNLHIAFEQLKEKLSYKGYFDQEYKQKIPYIPNTILVLTSPTGAVIRDILNVLGRRFTNARIKVLPIPVQGETAAPTIARSIKLANDKKMGDVIIIARGGGSLEELWPFNEEVVAESIFVSKIPIISAIGHETDFTISDFVADLRAPTPSAAAELVMPEKIQVLSKIDNLNIRLKNAILNNIYIKKNRITLYIDRGVFKRPFDKIYQNRMQLDMFDRYLKKNIAEILKNKKLNFVSVVQKMNALSPLAVLGRGYGITRNIKDGSVISSVKQINLEDDVIVSLKDGEISCSVKDIKIKK